MACISPTILRGYLITCRNISHEKTRGDEFQSHDVRWLSRLFGASGSSSLIAVQSLICGEVFAAIVSQAFCPCVGAVTFFSTSHSYITQLQREKLPKKIHFGGLKWDRIVAFSTPSYVNQRYQKEHMDRCILAI